MRKYIKRWYLYVLVFINVFSSCEKVDINFGSTNSVEGDPNITYFDNYKVDISTYKLDSFITSSRKLFTIGYHADPVFGVVKAGAYVQIDLPFVSLNNPVANKNVTFDSLEFIIKPTGEFYGDSTRPLKINIFRLQDNITNAALGDIYYNNSSFMYSFIPVGQQVVSLNAKAGSPVHIRLSDALGNEMFSKFKANDVDVASQEAFVNYFRGIYITTDSTVTNSLAYFTTYDSVFMRFSYHENGVFAVNKKIDLTYDSTKQFSNISFRTTGSDLSAFIPGQKQLITSAASGNKSFLNAALGTYIRIDFPTLLNLKEAHPYIKVVKALLEIRPDTKSYTFPYKLPNTLELYTTDNSNAEGDPIYAANKFTPQSGTLVIDELYGLNTYYTYDITEFINSKIAEGQFSQMALLLGPTANYADTQVPRLIVNDQASNATNNMRLKLYVLGL